MHGVIAMARAVTSSLMRVACVLHAETESRIFVQKLSASRRLGVNNVKYATSDLTSDACADVNELEAVSATNVIWRVMITCLHLSWHVLTERFSLSLSSVCFIVICFW